MQKKDFNAVSNEVQPNTLVTIPVFIEISQDIVTSADIGTTSMVNQLRSFL